MKKVLRFLLSLLLPILLAGVGYLTYMGFVPGLSKLIGATTPRSLGVTYTQADYDSFVSKTKTDYSELVSASTPDKSIIFSGQKALETKFTQAEASARLNYDQWAYMPFSNTQLRFNADGSFELSGNLVVSRLNGFIDSIGGVGYSKETISKGLGIIGLLKNDPTFYAKARVIVQNNQPQIAIESVELGRSALPIGNFDANTFLVNLTKQVFARVPGLDVELFTISSGEASFKGKIPEKLQVQFAK